MFGVLAHARGRSRPPSRVRRYPRVAWSWPRTNWDNPAQRNDWGADIWTKVKNSDKNQDNIRPCSRLQGRIRPTRA